MARANGGGQVGRPPLIRIAGLSKSFAGLPAVQDLSLDLRQGEFFCLLGPSGCGKSTLLRLLAGFETADRGRLELDGRDLTGVPPHRRPVNMMFQSYALFPHLTVAGNIRYGLKSERLSRGEAGARLREALDLVHLQGLESRYPAQLSGGQRQRVALARALAKRPRVLLLDEPLGALDRALRERTQIELKRLQAALGMTFVMVTHDQDEAMAMSDRIGVMEAGRLVQVGPPREVYERPLTRFVAEFLGDSNLLDGTVLGHEGQKLRVALRDGQAVTAAPAPSLAAGQAVALAIRPERLEISPAVAAPAGNGIAGRVQEMVYLGPETAWHVVLGTGETVRATRSNAAPAPFPDPLPGEEVVIRFRPEAALALP